ncbi:uncharacterized protein LOC121727109 [Aricia agestis]|uniref:uncharacterized protein LOC121727109 n=1 Tax=Aricia agestis TaxID=91739 RepID=UPI001C203588|nr:uncharacterized protein LOC121727109 [Aricia agestis]
MLASNNTGCGLRQGGLTSPSLFNIYINVLIEELSGAGVGCSIDGVCVNSISYADDMALLSPSISALRRLLSICETYASEHGLRYNVSKSELLVFKVGKAKPVHVPPVTINGTALKIVSKFKYLGHITNEDLRDDDDIERARRALAVRCNMLARRFARCTVEVKIALFKALRVQYNNAFRMLLALPRYCSASGMFADARTDDFPSVLRKRTASLMYRVRESDSSILKAICGQADGAIAAHWEHVHVHVSSAPVPWRKYAK